ncbi:hypothetical protein [Bacillus suaedae]|uniref:Uncharacterized protein n=1 Tax=Halalkalibacter suaedae TaxID=2822140 RepID=A0A940X0P7_9BACI|nr:hypothetical protein [Bacillus suaedae]MBP3953115.1 hypothetical protein [Bacillus suaedae]
MKKLLSFILIVSFVFAFPLSGFAAKSDSVNNGDKSKLFEKLGYENLSTLEANPEDTFLNEKEPVGQKVELNSKSKLKTQKQLKLKNKDFLRYAELGFSKEEVLDFTEADIAKLQDKHGSLVSVEDTYYKVTKEGSEVVPEDEALIEIEKAKNQTVNNHGEVSTQAFKAVPDTEDLSWMKMTTTVSSLGNNKYAIKNSYTWKTEPVFVLQDAVGISYSSHLTYLANSEYLKYTYDRYQNVFGGNYYDTKSGYVWSAQDKDPGVAFRYDLKGRDGDYVCVNHRGFAYVEIERSNKNYTSANAYGHYSHTEVAIAGSIGVKISTNNLSVTGATKVTKMDSTGVTIYF